MVTDKHIPLRNYNNTIITKTQVFKVYDIRLQKPALSILYILTEQNDMSAAREDNPLTFHETTKSFLAFQYQ